VELVGVVVVDWLVVVVGKGEQRVSVTSIVIINNNHNINHTTSSSTNSGFVYYLAWNQPAETRSPMVSHWWF